MWIGKINITELRLSSSWKAEFFSGEDNKLIRSKSPVVKLGEVVDVRRETIEPQLKKNEEFNYVGLENIESLTGELLDFSPKMGSEIKSRSRVFYQNDILYGRLRPYLNKVYLADGRVPNGICSGEFFVIVPDKNKILPVYLRWILASEYILDSVSRWQVGSALPRVQLEKLLGIDIPIPSLKKQQDYEKYIVKKMIEYRIHSQKVRTLPKEIINAFTTSLELGVKIS